MRDHVWLAAEQSGGVLTRRQALEVTNRRVLDGMLADGLLVRVFPSTYVLSDRCLHRDVLSRAALAYRGDVALARVPSLRAPALSHLDALVAWDLPCPPLPVTGPRAEPIHVTEGPGPAVRSAGITVHRRRHFATMQLWDIRAAGVTAVSPAQAVVESWPLLPARDRRAPLIVGLRDRRLRLADVVEVLDRHPHAASAHEMRHIADLVAGGLHSPLELWGHAHVFSDPRLGGATAQHPVTLRNKRTIYLDRYYDDAMVDVELDGAAYHGLPGQRERDLKRDAALSALGILVVRFSHQRLHSETAAVIAELVEILAVRRRQLGVA